MKKSIEINLGGRIFNIDDDAYELLNEYIESLRANFKDNEEGEERLNLLMVSGRIPAGAKLY